MKATMAMTLTIANQYSNSPKLPTCMALMAMRPTETADDPDPLRDRREPEGKVNGDCRDLRADGDDLDEGVGGANGEAGPLIEVGLRIDAEGAGDGMHDGHLRDGIGNDDRDDCAEEIRKDDAGTGQPNGDGTAKEEADADRAADGHHGQLALREPAFELGRAQPASRDG